jgi:hypothetical protein
MATIDIFNQDAFSTVSMLQAFEKIEYQPKFIQSLGIFVPTPVRTEAVMIENRSGVLQLIQSDGRGDPISRRTTEKRAVRNLNTIRIAEGDVIRASEIQGIRAFGTESELMQVQQEVMRRYNGPAGIIRNIELTWENLMLGAVQGNVLDADGSVIYNYFTEFGVSQPAEIAFDLSAASPASGAVKKLCNQVKRQMARAAKGASYVGVIGLCGDTFYDNLAAHSEVRGTYLQQQEATQLRSDSYAAVFDSFKYGGITWVNYQGTDDNSTVAVAATECKFIPVGGSGIFQMAYAPGETFDTVNTLGQPIYPIIVPDDDRNMKVEVEAYSYPLPICTRPEMLQRGRAGT